MDNFLYRNLKILREAKQLSLADMEQRIDIKKNTISNYENGVTEPNLTNLIRLSSFFGIDIGDLIQADLSKQHGQGAMETRVAYNAHIRPLKSDENKKFSIVTVDTSENSVVPILDPKAAAGSPFILDEPDYYRELPSFSFPSYFIRNGALASLQVRGDSMQPTIKQGDYVVGKELEDLNGLRNGEPYIIIYQEDQRAHFLVKRCYYHHGDDELLMSSDNTDYPDETIKADRILKLYHAQVCITTQLYRAESPVRGHLERIERRIDKIEQRLPKS